MPQAGCSAPPISGQREWSAGRRARTGRSATKRVTVGETAPAHETHIYWVGIPMRNMKVGAIGRPEPEGRRRVLAVLAGFGSWTALGLAGCASAPSPVPAPAPLPTPP